MLAENRQSRIYQGRAADMGILAASIETLKFPTETIKGKIEMFCRLALFDIDRGDLRNYPPHDRSFMETGRYYYGSVFNGCNDVEDIDRRMSTWLEAKGVNNEETRSWFKTNWVWEHIAGGGSTNDIPKEWKDKYLRAKINGIEHGFPSDYSDRKWDQYDEWEKVVTYRLVTNLAFTKAMFSFWPGLNQGQMEKLMALAQIYQLVTDIKHQKNQGELLMSKVVEGIKRNDRSYSAIDEVGFICSVTGLDTTKGMAAYLAARLACRGKRAEWDM